ncbi:MAG: hypothetical protein AABO41_10310 [Acidobacteriota bacterium]
MADKSKSSEIGGVASKDRSSSGPHPSRNLHSRAQGYGVAAGYEKPYLPRTAKPAVAKPDEYGPLPHSGYYGAGDSARPFKRGQAGYSEELLWYPAQYGEKTSGFEPSK